MAEVFGIAAGAAGFVSLLIQVVSGIDTLCDISNRAHEAPAELQSLLTELECLKYLMEKVKDQVVRDDDIVLQLCHESCKNVVTGLGKLQKKVLAVSEGRGKQRVLKIFAFRHWKEDVEVLHWRIQGAKINLILVNTYHTRVQVEEIKLLNQLHSPPPVDSSQEVNVHESLPLLLTADSYSSNKSEVDSQAMARIQPPKLRRQWNCAERACSCSCHRTARTARRFWSLDYTPLSSFRQPCDNKSCSATKYGGTFRFALSQLGIRWSAVIQFHVLATPGKFLFRPAFEVERIVPYTAPGFEILWRCKNHKITVKEAQDSLVDLYHSDPTFKDHVDPAGNSYIEWLVGEPWRFQLSRSDQHILLKLFMREFGMTKGINHPSFLVRCAKWIGEGPHLDLLEMLLELGFDATMVDSPHAQDWPKPSSPGWISEQYTPDPFFIEYQSMLLRDNQGFAKLAPLHEAVLLGSLESVNEWIPRSDKNERNFLGQTPVHFAVSKPRYLLALISAGHDVNATDNYGITPLMYAAASNHKESLIALLKAGADPSLRDTQFQRTFVEYAAIRRHWTLILKSLCLIEDLYGKDTAAEVAEHATILYHVVYPDYLQDSKTLFQQLLAKCGSVDFTFDGLDGLHNNLLHFVRSIKDIEALLEHGFTSINHVNSNGQHALISAALHRNKRGLLQRLVDAGAEIDHRDKGHHTALYHLLGQLQFGYGNELWETMDSLRMLLANGADSLCRDGCRCPCSPYGCLPSAAISYSIYEHFWGAHVPIWSFEWLNVVLEHRGKTEAKTILLSLIRKQKFEEMGMTHVCCGRGERSFGTRISHLQGPSMSDEDIDEILDEEAGFMEILENEMALSSATAYEKLLDDWILQIKEPLKKSCKKVMEYNDNVKSRRASSQRGHSVDYENDCFVVSVSSGSKKDPLRDATSDIADYILWMEHEYQSGSTSSLQVDNLPKDDWYSRRISWLHRLISALELSTAIPQEMGNLCAPGRKERYAVLDVEEGIKHFRDTWEVWEERQISLAGEVET